MLVLFAFGLLVLLFDLIHSIRPLPGAPPAPRQKNMERVNPTTLSPRQAFFLSQPMSINRADIQDLILLPGIGEQLAGRIIAFRDKNGGIHDPGELEHVAGVGKKLSRRISRFVVFSQP